MVRRTRNSSNKPRPAGPWLWVIAIFKLIKGLLLLATGIGVLSLLHKDVANVVAHWVSAVGVDPDNHYIHKVLVKLWFVDDRRLEQIGAGTFFYAALMLTEGVGLSLGKRWAEYFTIIATGSLLPLEVYELIKAFSVTKIVVILINAAVVWYLIIRLRHERKQ